MLLSGILCGRSVAPSLTLCTRAFSTGTGMLPGGGVEGQEFQAPALSSTVLMYPSGRELTGHLPPGGFNRQLWLK